MKTSDEDFIRAWKEFGSPNLVSKALGISIRAVYDRRRTLEARHGVDLSTTDAQNPAYSVSHSRAVVRTTLDNGVLLVASDCHFWPGVETTAYRAFLYFLEKLKPSIVVLNGDVFDGASISRHPSIGWEKKPSVVQELKECKSKLERIVNAAPKAKRFWTLGNHDMRFETRLASVAAEYRGVDGVHLKDHFPDWTPCWRLDINNDVVIKHRMRNGVHATHNNTLNAGKTIVTGHLHSGKVTPFTDYNGTRFGVDCATLADPDGPQFEDYLEAGPTNWRSGFSVLTFKDRKLLWPELVAKWDEEHVQFRGELIKV